MKLKPIPSLPSVKVAGRIPGDLHADLTAYSEYYREVLGERIDFWPLVVQMLRTFMHSDRAFRGVASSAPAQRGDICRPDPKRWAGQRVTT
jgi:hypothetical protein